MAGITAHNSGPGDFPHDHIADESKIHIQGNQSLSPMISVDEADDFFDPFSELNQFLYKKIREAIDLKICASDPSLYCEGELMNFILPEFRVKFPQYRLGNYAIRRIWETVIVYYNKLKNQPDLLTPSGEIDLPILIREALRQLDFNQTFHSFHPYTFASRVARQVAECVLIINDEVLSIQKLTHLIWNTMKHLIPRSQLKMLSSETFDACDQKLMKLALRLSDSHRETLHLKEALLNEFAPYQSLISSSDLYPIISFVAAKTLKPSLSIFNTFSKKTLLGIETFLNDQIEKMYHLTSPKQLLTIPGRITTLYRLTAGMEKTFAKQQLDDAIEYIQTLSSNTFNMKSPHLSSSIYNFINSELISMKKKKAHLLFEKIIQTLIDASEITAYFPRLNEDQIEELMIWSKCLLEKKIKSIQKLPIDLIRVIEKEVIEHMISHPHDSFEECTQTVKRSLEELKKSLTSFQEFYASTLDMKAEVIAYQNDMCATAIVTSPSHLLSFIKRHTTTKFPMKMEEISDEMTQAYIKENPFLSYHSTLLKKRIYEVAKIYWYHQRKKSPKSTYHFFLVWQQGQTLTYLEEIALKKVPFAPYRPQAFYSYLRKEAK